MSDIVERLRQPLVHGLQHPNDEERAEAADEIERLTELLTEEAARQYELNLEIERLRAREQQRRRGHHSQMVAAGKEIERLRAALQQIADDGIELGGDACEEMARRALEGK